MAARLGKTEQDVRDAAVALVVRGGSTYALSVAGVARELGCASPSIYHHVPSGYDGLLDMVINEAKDRLKKALADNPDTHPLLVANEWATNNYVLYEFIRDDIWDLPGFVDRLDPPVDVLIDAIGHQGLPALLEYMEEL